MSERLVIEQNRVKATSAEGAEAWMPIDAFLTAVAARRQDTGGVVLPDGVKAIISEGGQTIWVHETPPAMHKLKWLAADSPMPFGLRATYRDVKLALPYMIIFLQFLRTTGGKLVLGNNNECFFRTEPLKSMDDPLCYAGLLNVSSFGLTPVDGKPLAWICNQHMQRTSAMSQADDTKRMVASFDQLKACLMETGFNMSSERHEGASWFGHSCKVDKRIATVEEWERNSIKKPLFVLDVPWIPVGMSVRQVANRIMGATETSKPTTGALARVVFNHKEGK